MIEVRVTFLYSQGSEALDYDWESVLQSEYEKAENTEFIDKMLSMTMKGFKPSLSRMASYSRIEYTDKGFTELVQLPESQEEKTALWSHQLQYNN